LGLLQGRDACMTLVWHMLIGTDMVLDVV